jgi:hypothetical protein
MFKDKHFRVAVASWLALGFLGFFIEAVVLITPRVDYLGRPVSQMFLLMAFASIAMVGQVFTVCHLVWKVRILGRVALAALGATLGFFVPWVLLFLMFPAKAIAVELHFGADLVEASGWVLLCGFPVLLGGGVVGGIAAGLQRSRCLQSGDGLAAAPQSAE